MPVLGQEEREKDNSEKFFEKYKDVEDEEVFIEEKLIIYLSYLKIAPNLKGYVFIKGCIKKLVLEPMKKRNLTNGVYREIGEEYQISTNLIDRAIRHALLVSFKKEGIEDFESRTGYCFSSARPTPREAICLLAELVNMDLITFKVKKNFKNLA